MHSAQQKFYTIGEAAKLLDLSSETLRRWDRQGKIKIARTPSGNRVFSLVDIEWLKNSFNVGNQLQIPTAQEATINPSEPEVDTEPEIEIKQPYTTLNKLKFSYKTSVLAILILIVVLSNLVTVFTLLNFSPELKTKAVLGVETFAKPVLQRIGLIESLMASIQKTGSQIGSFIDQRVSVVTVGLLEREQGTIALSDDLKVNGNAILGDSQEDSLIINSGIVTFRESDKILDLTGEGTRTLSILNSNAGQSADLDLSDGDLLLGGRTRITNSGEGLFTNLSSTTLIAPNISTDSLTVSKTINGSTLSSTALTFTGTSASIYPSSSDTSLFLNGGTTGTVNIGNSSTGDIHIGGGTQSSGCTITNNNGSLNCSSSITTQEDLIAKGNTTLGDATTDAVTINPATVIFSGGNKTLDIAGAATRTLTFLNSTAGQVADIDLSDGNLKVNGSTIITNAGAGSFTTVAGTLSTASQTNVTAVGTLGSLSVTGNINSVSGGIQTNGVTRIDNSGNFTTGTGAFAGNITPSLDATYSIGSESVRWLNGYFSGDVVVGDAVFKNDFRLTEGYREKTHSIDMLNPKGEMIASFDENGNFWVKGEIRQWKKN